MTTEEIAALCDAHHARMVSRFGADVVAEANASLAAQARAKAALAGEDAHG
jgi:hypothetical protein